MKSFFWYSKYPLLNLFKIQSSN